MAVDRQNLLTSKQVARFVADGMLQFEGIVPAEINEIATEEMRSGVLTKIPWNKPHLKSPDERAGAPLSAFWRDSAGVGAMLRLPQIQGIVESLVGPDPIYDHHAVHVRKVQGEPSNDRSLTSLAWHRDATPDFRKDRFDVQLFYFPHDTPAEMGGTAMLPGSHLHDIVDIGHFQNFKGQVRVICPAGTILVAHQNIWHCARHNYVDRERVMFKLRLNPRVPQFRLWNTDDLDDVEIHDILYTNQGWLGYDHWVDVRQRVRLWRLMTGDESYDVANMMRSSEVAAAGGVLAYR